MVWDNLPAHLGRAMWQLIAARPWLPVYQLTAYSPELNPVEAVWSNLQKSLANPHQAGPRSAGRDGEDRLKRMQHRPGLTDGFPAKTGLDLTLVISTIEDLLSQEKLSSRRLGA